MSGTAAAASGSDIPIIVSGCFRKPATLRFMCGEYDQLVEYCRTCDDATRVYLVSDPAELRMESDGMSRAGFFYSREALFGAARVMHPAFSTAIRELAVPGRRFAGTDVIARAFDAFLKARGEALVGCSFLTTYIPKGDLTLANCVLDEGRYGDPFTATLRQATQVADQAGYSYLAASCDVIQLTVWYTQGAGKRGVVVWSRRGEADPAFIAPCLVFREGTWTLTKLQPERLSTTAFDADWSDRFEEQYRSAENGLRRLRELPLQDRSPGHYTGIVYNILHSSYWVKKAMEDALFFDGVWRDEVTASGSCERIILSLIRGLRTLDLRTRLRLEPLLGEVVSQILGGVQCHGS